MYQPNRWYLKSGHVQTILSSIIKIKKNFIYSRQRIDTIDNDFIDVDWVKNGSSKLVVIVHGMGSNTNSNNIISLINYISNTWDCAAINLRGSSGESNNTIKFAHSGQIEDIDLVLQNISDNYEEICIIGLSLGGNLVFNYLGRHPNVNKKITHAIGVSVPLNLGSCSDNLNKLTNRIYLLKFLKKLNQLVINKIREHPEFNLSNDLNKIKTIRDYDNIYTAPSNGMIDSEEYYNKHSSKDILKNIKVPTLLISAKNDPLLTSDCYPRGDVNALISYEFPDYGGHVGLLLKGETGYDYWYNGLIKEFIENPKI